MNNNFQENLHDTNVIDPIIFETMGPNEVAEILISSNDTYTVTMLTNTDDYNFGQCTKMLQTKRALLNRIVKNTDLNKKFYSYAA